MEVEIMDRSMNEIKHVANGNLKHEIKSTEIELESELVENIINTKKTIKKSDRKPQNTSVDILLLIDEFKNRFEKLGEKAREIAQKDGRSIVTYDDAEEALKLIRAENKRAKKFDQI